MPVERRNPLPAGRYWLDLFPPLAAGKPDGREHFHAWHAQHKDKVSIEATETFPDAEPPREFVIFRTSEPLPWGPDMASAVGFPDRASESITSSADTVQRPPPEEAPKDAIQTVTRIVAISVGAVVVLGALHLLYVYLRGKAQAPAAKAA